ncbi:DUF3500 domain-containing protein [Blastococcus sp. SYSU DS0533]
MAPDGRGAGSDRTWSSGPSRGRCWAPTWTGARGGVAVTPVRRRRHPRRRAHRLGGPDGARAPHYYRVQGPRLLVERNDTQRGADHAHPVWRDPAADSGLGVLVRHRAAAHG